MKFQKIIIFLLFFLCYLSLSAQDSLVFQTPADSVISVENIDSLVAVIDSNKLVVVFAGDIMGHDTQIEGAWVDSTETYDYEPTFRHIKDYLSAADIAVGNLEVTLAGPPFKGYPQFSSPDALALEARDAGFQIFVAANNHALDRGTQGMERTISMLDSFNVVHAGIYRSREERERRYPLIVENKGFRLALLNYTYGTNGLKVPEPYLVNRIDTAQIRKDISKAKLANPDYLICTIHWGTEYERTENTKQQKLAYFLLDNGVDAIIGSHPHVVQPVRLLNCSADSSEKLCPVVYSMGNLVSNQRAQYKDGGIMAELHLSRKDSIVQFDSIYYMPYWVYREEIETDKYTFFVLPVAKYESDSTIVSLNDNDLYKLNRFKKDTRELLQDSSESSFYIKEE